MATHQQLRQARNLPGLTASEEVGAGRSDVTLFEGGQIANPELATKLTAYYETLGIEFGDRDMVGLRPGLTKTPRSSRLH